MATETQQLLDTLPQVGAVQWIGLRPSRGAPVDKVDQVIADVDKALIGDRFDGPSGAARQVTLIQKEHLDAVAALLDREEVDPALIRRNIVVSGINLLALKKRAFQIGDAILVGTGNCQPCSLMEKNLGPGGYNAMRGHGGITASVSQGGTIRIGDEVKLIVESN